MDASSPVISPAAFDWNQWVGLSWRQFDLDGFICWAFVRELVRAGRGVALPAFHDRDLPAWRIMTVAEAQPWDVMQFAVAPGRVHVGVVVMPGKFIHAGYEQDSCVERYTSMAWRNRIEGVYRHQ